MKAHIHVCVCVLVCKVLTVVLSGARGKVVFIFSKAMFYKMVFPSLVLRNLRGLV